MSNPGKSQQIITLPTDKYHLWDAFVDASPQGTLFHKSSWAEIIENVFDRPAKIVTIIKNEEIQAGIMFWPKTNLGIKSITHVPNTTYQGFLFKAPESSKASTINAAHEKLSRLLVDYLISHYDLIDIPLTPFIHDIRPFKWQNFKVHVDYTYCFPIKEFSELEKQFSQDLRRKLKDLRADEVDISESDNTEFLTSFILDSYKEHGITPAISAVNIKKFMDECLSKKLGIVYYQYLDGQPVAGIFLLHDPDNVYALFSGIDGKYRQKVNSELIHAYVLQQAQFKGKMFDFLGANTPQLEQFKRSFGGNLTSFYKVTYTKTKAIELLLKARSVFHIGKRRVKSFY